MSAEFEQHLDHLWVQHTAPGDNDWDNWRRYGRAVAQAEREAVLNLCALEGVTIADIIRVMRARDREADQVRDQAIKRPR